VNILAVISSAGVYGAERMVLNLLAALSTQACHPVLAVLRGSCTGRSDLACIARECGLHVEEIDCNGRIDLNAVRKLRECVQRYRVDVVHSHGYKADLYSYAATRRPRIPLVATCHNWTNADSALTLYAKLDRLALARFDAVAAVSEGVAGILSDSRVPHRKVSVIPNGVLVEKQQMAKSIPDLRGGPGMVIGMVGRLVQEKGFALVLRGARAILSAYPATRFLIVGEGQQEKELRDIVLEEGIETSVFFSGFRNDLTEVYSSLDLLVLPSLLEGMPMVVLEAMASCKPVVVTRVGALPALVSHGITGLVVDPGNTPVLVAAICSLLSDPERCRTMGQRGRDLIEVKYSSRIMAQRYRSMYQQAIGTAAVRSLATPCPSEGVQ
jgi:glycosyltransferase involved in cell wall biosynthesis